MTKRWLAPWLLAAALRADFALPPVTLVSGRILDDLGNPFRRAHLFARDEGFNVHITTDSRADGRFALHLEPGTYRISASHGGFSEAAQEIEVAGLPVEGLELVLKSSWAEEVP